jgi:hypothetical protein
MHITFNKKPFAVSLAQKAVFPLIIHDFRGTFYKHCIAEMATPRRKCHFHILQLVQNKDGPPKTGGPFLLVEFLAFCSLENSVHACKLSPLE